MLPAELIINSARAVLFRSTFPVCLFLLTPRKLPVCLTDASWGGLGEGWRWLSATKRGLGRQRRVCRALPTLPRRAVAPSPLLANFSRPAAAGQLAAFCLPLPALRSSFPAAEPEAPPAAAGPALSPQTLWDKSQSALPLWTIRVARVGRINGGECPLWDVDKAPASSAVRPRAVFPHGCRVRGRPG